MIRIRSTSLVVDDQQRALDFYTRVLGFRLKQDLLIGGARWVAVTDSDSPDGVELRLLAAALEEEQILQKVLYRLGVAAAAFGVEDIDLEFVRLCSLGVRFHRPVARAPRGKAATVLLDDGCGNWIHLFQL